MMRSPAPLRRGYTLLEVLIASFIGMMLLSAVYYAFDLTLRSSDAGRTLVAENDLNRAVVNRMSLDLSSPLGVLPPMSGGDPAASSGGTATTGTTTTGTTSTTDTTMTTTTDSLIPFQGGLIGTSDQMILFVSRVPKWLSDRETNTDTNAALPSDVTRVSYYLHSSGKGLCRQELPWITADTVGRPLDIDRTNEDADVIAPEVVALAFEYSDGTGYVSEWDGTQAATDGAAATGPPRAVRATITFEYSDRDGNKAQKKIVHVFPMRSAIGLYVPPTPPETTTTGGM